MSFSLVLNEKGGAVETKNFDKDEITIGRVKDNDIVLPKNNISKRHARIVRKEGRFKIVDLKSTNGTYINGRRIEGPYDLKEGDKIYVGDFTIELDHEGSAADDEAPPPIKAKAPPPPPEDLSEPVALEDDAEPGEWSDDAHPPAAAAEGDDDWGDAPAPPASDDLDLDSLLASAGQQARKDPTRAKKAPEPADDAEISPDAETGMGPLPTRSKQDATPVPQAAPSPPPMKKPQPIAAQKSVSALNVALPAVHKRLLKKLDLRRLDPNLAESELRTRTEAALDEILDAMAEAGDLPEGVDLQELKRAALDEALGLGPIQDLLNDEEISEVMVNGPDQIFVERKGRIELTDKTFASAQGVLTVIERIVARVGRRIDEASPMVDARLPDGSRVNAIVPPLSLKGPCLTIRKFTKEQLTGDDLVMRATLSAEMAEFLSMAVRYRQSIVISGGTGSGKTTTLGVLSSYIPEDERIITIEDAAELRLPQAHVVALETRPPNLEGRGEITIRDLVRNALRMRPDRIVVGECRGGEALDMLQAMNTGHEGSLTTLHSNSPRDALARLETLVLMSGMELPIRAIRDQVASAVGLIVQQARLSDGSRRITHISEVTGLEGDVITMQDLFVFEQSGADKSGKIKGTYKSTGQVPHFYEALKKRGVDVDFSPFQG